MRSIISLLKDILSFLAGVKNFIKASAPVELFNDDSNNATTITLVDSVANYSYIEIQYKSSKDQDNQVSSVRVYEPNGKKAVLFMTVYANSSIHHTSYAIYSINENKMTAGNVGYLNWVSWDAGKASNIRITKVYGYKI